MSEPGKVEATKKSNFSWRDGLKFLGISALGAGLVAVASKYPEINRFWQEEGPLITGEAVNLDNIASEIPPQLANLEIPTKNEQFRHMTDIFEEGLLQYLHWMNSNSSLSQLTYERPDNYLDIPSIAERISPDIDEIPSRIGEDYWAMSWALDAIGEIDKPYSMIVAGSTDGISSLENMIKNDPGTGFVNSLRESSKMEFGDSFDMWQACRSNTLSSEQREYLSKQYIEWHQGAMNYILREVKKDGKPISTSALFSYFLFKNDGNILRSVWDTSSWLKITSRNDVEDLKFNPNNDKAKLITSLFKDEFAEKISANWVVENVEPEDKLLNNVEAYDNYQYKDYMPPNRVGFYHSWNIVALGLHMSPFLLKRMVASHLVGTLFGNDINGKKITEYGKERTISDWSVAENISKILKLIKKYSI